MVPSTSRIKNVQNPVKNRSRVVSGSATIISTSWKGDEWLKLCPLFICQLINHTHAIPFMRWCIRSFDVPDEPHAPMDGLDGEVPRSRRNGALRFPAQIQQRQLCQSRNSCHKRTQRPVHAGMNQTRAKANRNAGNAVSVFSWGTKALVLSRYFCVTTPTGRDAPVSSCITKRYLPLGSIRTGVGLPAVKSTWSTGKGLR